MKSPFPGMDPYLERHWSDVHASLISFARNALNDVLPDDLIARAEERIAVESDSGTTDQLTPDVRVLEAVGRGGPKFNAIAQGGESDAPYRLVALVEPIIERFIEILDSNGERVITVIEFLSPANKRGKGLEEFLTKREMLLAGNVNFVEVDLVRQGDWRRMLKPHSPPNDVVSSYRATIRIASESTAVYYHPMSLRVPLPSLKIPLRESDKPADLALQPLVESAYRTGRYSRSIDYTADPHPPLDAEDAAWADELLKAAGKR